VIRRFRQLAERCSRNPVKRLGAWFRGECIAVILLDAREGSERKFRLSPSGALTGAVALVATSVMLGWGLGAWTAHSVSPALAEEWQEALHDQQSELTAIEREADRMLRALTRRFAELQGRLARMEALGERMVMVADLDATEFDFSEVPALGGPDGWEIESVAVETPEFVTMVEQLTDQILARQQQLDVLGGLLDDREFRKDVVPAGRPVQRGWQSSGYGRRADPFSGRMAMHSGVDFAAQKGSNVYAVAGGVVVFSGRRGAYGNMVEINHGNGYSTRYAHSTENLVELGDAVRKGDVIATVGATGRATGPHVHLEVLKDGKHVNPARYVARDRR